MLELIKKDTEKGLDDLLVLIFHTKSRDMELVDEPRVPHESGPPNGIHVRLLRKHLKVHSATSIERLRSIW